MSIVSKFGGSGLPQGTGRRERESGVTLPREVLSAAIAVVTTNGKKSAEVVVAKKSL